MTPALQAHGNRIRRKRKPEDSFIFFVKQYQPDDEPGVKNHVIKEMIVEMFGRHAPLTDRELNYIRVRPSKSALGIKMFRGMEKGEKIP